MANLDSIKEIEKFDKGNILTSIRYLDRQIEQAITEIKKIKVPESYKDIVNVVVCGMGGSALGARIIKSLTSDSARVPIEIVNDYKIPYYVGEETLLIISSYSGSTEETISSLNHAINARAKIFGVTTGGKLAEILRSDNIPSYIFDPKENVSGQPRMALGYSIAATISILNKCEVFYISDEDIQNSISTTLKSIEEYDAKMPENKNIAKSLAKKIVNKGILLFASSHLYGVTYAFKNQLNENSKTFSAIFELPEANHHLLEGLKFPVSAKDNLTAFFVESKNYSREIAKRYEITRDVVKRCGIKSVTYKTISNSKLEEIFEVLVLGSYISFYLAILNDIDPSNIPWVDYFKEKLK
jgi:glucose/mannose-6-phosphate isomerase